MKANASSVWVFVGPSLPREAVRKIFPKAVIAPPAAQGDVWKAIAQWPSVIVLLDGVFESSPSVWHHELLAAMRAGIAVFGGASMGALRASELHRFGMVGVGRIFEAFREGVLVDDAEVAMLHAPADAAHRSLTVPLVNIRFTAEQALSEGALSHARARELVRWSEEIFYQARPWPKVLRVLQSRWPASTFQAFQSWVGSEPRDLKALDATQTLQAAKAWSQRPPEKKRCLLAQAARGSSLVRHRRNAAKPPTGPEDIIDEQALDGTRRLILARWARSLGAKPSPTRVAELRMRLTQMAQQTGDTVEAWAQRFGVGADELERLFEDLALDASVVCEAPRWIQDGPSLEEGRFLSALLNVDHS